LELRGVSLPRDIGAREGQLAAAQAWIRLFFEHRLLELPPPLLRLPSV
jgi:hypothetical protein